MCHSSGSTPTLVEAVGGCPLGQWCTVSCQPTRYADYQERIVIDRGPVAISATGSIDRPQLVGIHITRPVRDACPSGAQCPLNAKALIIPMNDPAEFILQIIYEREKTRVKVP